MHFGEYELSPSLISLSPPPSGHPEAFQRLSVRSSSQCYLTFNLPKGRSLGFASTPTDYTPCSDSLSLRIHISRCLTLPVKVTRRFIMQKARRHCLKQLRPLVGARFQGLFHSSIRSAFHLSFTVLVRYRSLGSIQPYRMVPADSRKIPRVPRYSGYHYASFSFEYRTITVYGPIFQRVLLTKLLATSWSYNPNIAVTTLVWANPRSLATTWGIIIIFFSCRY